MFKIQFSTEHFIHRKLPKHKLMDKANDDTIK